LCVLSGEYLFCFVFCGGFWIFSKQNREKGNGDDEMSVLNFVDETFCFGGVKGQYGSSRGSSRCNTIRNKFNVP